MSIGQLAHVPATARNCEETYIRARPGVTGCDLLITSPNFLVCNKIRKVSVGFMGLFHKM